MSKTANNWRGSKPLALEQQLSRQVGGAVGVDWSFDRKRPGLMKWLTPTLQSVSVNQAIRTMRMRQRTGPHPQQWSSPIEFLLLRDYAGRGGIRNRRMFQRHCSQYAGAGANAALSLPSIRFSTRSRHASFTSIFPKFSPLKSLRKAVGAFSMPCSTL